MSNKNPGRILLRCKQEGVVISNNIGIIHQYFTDSWGEGTMFAPLTFGGLKAKNIQTWNILSTRRGIKHERINCPEPSLFLEKYSYSSFLSAYFLWISTKRFVILVWAKWLTLWLVGIWLMDGKAHHAHFPFSLLQFFCSPPNPTTTTLASCFLPSLSATKQPKNKSLDFSWTQFCHHCSDISCLFVQLNLAFRRVSGSELREL